MAKTTQEIISIISAGSGVVITDERLTFDLLNIARIAKKMQVHIWIEAGERTVYEMVNIARAGGGFVTFDLKHVKATQVLIKRKQS